MANQEAGEDLRLEVVPKEVKLVANQEVKGDPRLGEGHDKEGKEAFNDHLLEAVLVEVDKVALLKAASPHSMDTEHHKEAINDLRLEEVGLKEDNLVKVNL